MPKATGVRRQIQETSRTTKRVEILAHELETLRVDDVYARALIWLELLMLPDGHPNAVYTKMSDGSLAQLSARYSGMTQKKQYGSA